MADITETFNQDKLIIKNMEEVMHEAMMPYSEHVIMDRALPRVEDGLKPVQRRILYTMMELGLKPDMPYRKSALAVGDCLAKFHPHGDKSVYDAMVRLAQPFNMRHTLVDGHGNFGSVDGDSAAAMRYTEARLSALAMELLRDIDKNTVKWSFNFDDRLKEPDMLPGRFPNLLVNGSSGIAVGLATNIPPHNLGEVIDGVIAYIENRHINLKNMMKIIKGPDFPSGGFMIINEELEKAYTTGKGKIIMRAKVHIENAENDKKLIVIDELPFQVNKANLLESIMHLREEKKGILAGISDIVDESDRNGMRAVIKVKRDVDPKQVIAQLFKSTNLQQSFGINMVAIADGKPQQMGLLDIIAYYVDYQISIILKRTKFELEEAKDRAHILEGLVVAVKNIDEVIKIIKKSPNTTEARQNLRDRFSLSEVQAQAILDMRLARLTSLEIYKLEKELAELLALIERLQAIVGSRKLQMELIKTELLQIKRNFKDNRRTQILNTAADYVIPSDSDAKPVEDCVIGYNQMGALKRMTAKHFSMAGKEFSQTSTAHEIYSIVLKTVSNETLYCFTNLGNCYKVEVETMPDARWKDKAAHAKELIADLQENEKIVWIKSIGEEMPKGSLLFYTKEGMIKRSDYSEYSVVKSSFQAIKLREGDELIGVEQDLPNTTIFFVTEQGMCLNADKSDIPTQGRVAGGVKGIMLNDGDSVIACGQASPSDEILLVTDRAYAKRVGSASIDVMSRYRKGVKIIDFKGDNGARLCYAEIINTPMNIVLTDNEDYASAFNSLDIAQENRTSRGKPLLKLKADEQIKSVAPYKNSV